MSNKFKQIPYNEMDECLIENGFNQIQIEGTKEYVYEKEFGISPTIRICRLIGKDAIRVIIFSKVNNSGLINYPKVLRINSWKKNLLNRLLLANEFIEKYISIYGKRDISEINEKIKNKMKNVK